MNKVEQLIIESVQQSLSSLERIDITTLQGLCAPFADEHCRLDNLATLLGHCKRFQEASRKGDTGQAMLSRRDINVYSRTMGFSPEGVDSLLNLLVDHGKGIPVPPSPPLPPMPDNGQVKPVFPQNPQSPPEAPKRKGRAAKPLLFGSVIGVVVLLVVVLYRFGRTESNQVSNIEKIESTSNVKEVEPSNGNADEKEEWKSSKNDRLNSGAVAATFVLLVYPDTYYIGQVEGKEKDYQYYIKRYTFTKKQEKEAKDASRREFMEQQIDNMEGAPQNRDYWYYFNFPTEQISEKRLYILDSLTVSAEIDIADPEMPKEANAALQKARRQVIAGDSKRLKPRHNTPYGPIENKNRRKKRI